MASTPWAGYNLKVRINTNVYAVSRVLIRDAVPPQDVSNTEGNAGNTAAVGGNPAFASALGGQSQATIELTQPTFDSSNNPFTAPLSIAPGSFVSIIVYLNLVGGKNWNFPSVLITEGELNGDVKTLEPITLRGVSDQVYTRPA